MGPLLTILKSARKNKTILSIHNVKNLYSVSRIKNSTPVYHKSNGPLRRNEKKNHHKIMRRCSHALRRNPYYYTCKIKQVRAKTDEFLWLVTYREIVFTDVDVELLESSQVVELPQLLRGHLLQQLPQLLVTHRLGVAHIFVVILHLSSETTEKRLE